MKIILDDKYCLNLKPGTTTIVLSVRDASSRVVKNKATGEEETISTDKDIRWFNNLPDALVCYTKIAASEYGPDKVISLKEYIKIVEDISENVLGVVGNYGIK